MQAYRMIQDLPEGHWKMIKSQEIKTIIQACMALYLEATADDYSATPGSAVELTMEVINRSDVKAQLESVQYLPNGVDSTLYLALPNNQSFKFYKQLTIPEETVYTSPYWLNEPSELGMYNVSEQALRGLPETPRALKVLFTLNIEGTDITWEQDVVFKKTDPVKGETYRPFEVLPPVFANIQEPVYVFANLAPTPVQVLVKSGEADFSGKVALSVPEGWRYEPEAIDVELRLKGEEYLAEFQLYPPEGQSEGNIQALVHTEDGTFKHELKISLNMTISPLKPYCDLPKHGW